MSAQRPRGGKEPPDREVQALLAEARGAGRSAIHELSVDQARAQVLRMREVLAPGPAMERVEELSIPVEGGAIAGRRYRPGAKESTALIVYFHGGGWVLGGLNESDALCRSLAAASACDLISVDYRLAPEHRFPTAVDDADAAVRWIADGPGNGKQLVLVGDSAGGNLAAVAARRARDRGGPPISLQVLVYPVTDHRMDTPSYARYGEGFLVTAKDMAWFWDHYVPEVAGRSSPDAAPLLAPDLTGLPPALFLVAEYDVLRDEAIAYAERLDDAGVEVTVERYETMIHGFFPLLGLLSTAQEAVDFIGATIAELQATPIR